MNRNSIRWGLPTSYVVIALLAALTLGSMMLFVLRGYYADQEREYLEGNAMALRAVIEQILQSDLPEASLQNQIRTLAFLSQTQIRLTDTSGNTIVDSGVPNSKKVVAVQGGAPFAGNVMFSVPVNPPAEKGPVLIYRNEPLIPEVVPLGKETVPAKAADIILSVNASPYGYGFVSKAGVDRESRSAQVVSVPLIASTGKPLGELEISNGPSYGADIIDSVTSAWLVASIFAIAIAALAGWFMSRRVTQPVLALESATRKMEHGDLSVRVNLQNERQQEFLSLAGTFNGMAEQVEQTVSALRAFVADAAHELHTPLTALQTNLELARAETLVHPSAGEILSRQSHYLLRAQEQAQRLEALVQSLLDLSRIEGAGSKSDFARLDFSQLVREMSEQFASRAEQSEHEFEIGPFKENVEVTGNIEQLRQVILNLLENSLKFTPKHGHISIALQMDQNNAVLTIADRGIGIPAEDVPHLFERFHRGHNASSYAGNGLGLAIVKAILTAHGGNITARSEIGTGTQMIVFIPHSHRRLT